MPHTPIVSGKLGSSPYGTLCVGVARRSIEIHAGDWSVCSPERHWLSSRAHIISHSRDVNLPSSFCSFDFHLPIHVSRPCGLSTMTPKLHTLPLILAFVWAALLGLHRYLRRKRLPEDARPLPGPRGLHNWPRDTYLGRV